MQAGMNESGRMTVNAFVAIEIGGLQHEVAQEVLGLEKHQAPEKKGHSGIHVPTFRTGGRLRHDPAAIGSVRAPIETGSVQIARTSIGLNARNSKPASVSHIPSTDAGRSGANPLRFCR